MGASREQAGAAPSSALARKKRRLSAAGRKAIIEATKRRWAALRKGSDSSASNGVLNHMDLAVEFQRIYAREINVEIEWFWDCGIECGSALKYTAS
jgi:hypothetical protein